MKVILDERRFLEEANLWAECPQFKCANPEGACCYQILFNQPEFKAQKPALFELVEAHCQEWVFHLTKEQEGQDRPRKTL